MEREKQATSGSEIRPAKNEPRTTDHRGRFVVIVDDSGRKKKDFRSPLSLSLSCSFSLPVPSIPVVLSVIVLFRSRAENLLQRERKSVDSRIYIQMNRDGSLDLSTPRQTPARRKAGGRKIKGLSYDREEGCRF